MIEVWRPGRPSGVRNRASRRTPPPSRRASAAAAGRGRQPPTRPPLPQRRAAAARQHRATPRRRAQASATAVRVTAATAIATSGKRRASSRARRSVPSAPTTRATGRSASAATVRRAAIVRTGAPRRDRDRERQPSVAHWSLRRRSGATRSRIRIRRSPSCGAQGAARGQQGALEHASAWTASASTSGCGMRGWCARARPRRRSPAPAMCGSTARASTPPAGRCGRATSSPSRSTAACG